MSQVALCQRPNDCGLCQRHRVVCMIMLWDHSINASKVKSNHATLKDIKKNNSNIIRKICVCNEDIGSNSLRAENNLNVCKFPSM